LVSRSQIVAVVTLAVLIWGAFTVASTFRQRQENPAVQRLDSQRVLRAYAAALAVYRQDHAAWPDDIRQLWDHPRFSEVSGLAITKVKRVLAGHLVTGGGFYQYRPPRQGDGQELVMASPRAHDAVAAGELFGEAGARAETAIPAVHFALDSQLQLRSLSDEEQRLRAPWVYED
jgi:hypothetical protein